MRPNIVRDLKNSGLIIFGFILVFNIYLVFFYALGLGYEVFYFPHTLENALRMTAIGFAVGTAVAVADIFFFSKTALNLPFLLRLFSGTLLYVAVSLLVILLFVIGEEYFLRRSFGVFSLESRLKRFFSGEFPVLLGYLIIVSLIFNSFRLIVERIGEKNFWNVISGRYHTSHEEERVIMFLDLHASVYLAQKMGDKLYHELLHDIFNDIADPVNLYGGEIYQYLGDGAVVTWDIQAGTRQCNCIRCFFEIVRRIEMRADEYEKRYQHVPLLKAGFHAGKVIAGEVGEEKREIVFHGDTVNTASRIQDQCVWLNEQILLSETLLSSFSLRQCKGLESCYKGDILLKGKEEKIPLYTIRKVT